MADRRLAAALREALEGGRAAGVFPAAAAWVAEGGRFRARAFAGAAGPDTLWDLASLTKPMGPVTLAMRGVAAGWLSLDERVRAPAGVRATVRELLAHRSGLAAWTDLASWLDGAAPGWRPGAARIRALAARRLGELGREAPSEARPTVYSDLGFIVLGWHLERRLGQPLRALVPGYRGVRPAAAGAPGPARAAGPFLPTGRCPRRGRAALGDVDDLNAWVLGGAAGHAGLFARLDRVGGWALDLARAAAGRPSTHDGGVVRAFWDPAERAPGATWVLGWDTPTPGASSAGRHAGPRAVGHLGFTGTSVWVDRDRDRVVVLLTNRVALGPASQEAIRAFRPAFHDRVHEALGAGP